MQLINATLALALVFAALAVALPTAEPSGSISSDGYVFSAENMLARDAVMADGSVQRLKVREGLEFVENGPTSKAKRLEYSVLGMENACSASSFENHTSGGSPTVSDCQNIQGQLEGRGSGAWVLSEENVKSCKVKAYCVLISYGSCQFGVYRDPTFFDPIVGVHDVSDLIRDSISKFNTAGRIGAEGNMHCAQYQLNMHWAIFHT